MSFHASRVLAALSLLAVVALPCAAQKTSPTLKKSAPVAAPPARPASEPQQPAAAPAATRSKPLAPGLRGEFSSVEENEGREADPVFDPKALLSKGKSAPKDAASTALRLVNHPKRDELARWLVDSVRGREIDIALLGGEKYMINSCLGIKVSAGKFKLKLDNPVVRFENSGIVVSFSIDHVSFSAIKLRMRPNPNILEACSFSKKFEVGGSMEDVRLTLRLDPLYDPERCRLGWVTDLNPEVRIGNLNLKPLQNDLDRMAKNMVEDSLTFALQVQSDGILSAMGDLLLSAVDQFLEADCPTRPGDTGRAIADLTRGVGLGGHNSGSGGGAGSGGTPTAGSTPTGGATGSTPSGGASGPAGGSTGGQAGGSSAVGSAEIAALLGRIEALEVRIAELEASGFSPGAAQGSSSAAHAGDLAALLRQILEQGGGLERPEAASQIFSELLAQLLAAAAQSPSDFDAAHWLADRAGQQGAAGASSTIPASAAAPAPWYLVPNPALTGRMGRIVVRFSDKELSKGTAVAVLRDGKKVTDRYGSGDWEFLPGIHDVVVTRATVIGCEVRSGQDTVVRVGLLQVELAKDTLFAVYAKGGSEKLFDSYGSASVGFPIGEYEVEIQGQRVAVVLRDGEVTRF